MEELGDAGSVCGLRLSDGGRMAANMYYHTFKTQLSRWMIRIVLRKRLKLNLHPLIFSSWFLCSHSFVHLRKNLHISTSKTFII